MSDGELRTLWWQDGALRLVDQRLLPGRTSIVTCHTHEDVARAIKSMQIRGAPAIGCAAAYGMALAAGRGENLAAAKALLDAQRPTAVNLAWATGRMLERAQDLSRQSTPNHTTAETQSRRENTYLSDSAPPRLCGECSPLAAALLAEAHAILAEDLAMCHAIGDHGAPLIPARGRVLTHCNAGGLATAGYGTALAPIRTAHAAQRPIHVLVDETRPFLQGARLTAWELQQAAIPFTLITDNMAAYFMQQGEVDCVIVGADRIAANGDAANKIGTYGLAVLARAHDIPFYVAAPSSTVDCALAHGGLIPIEQRSSDEVLHIGDTRIAPEGTVAAHPAFDVTPARLITAIITERGVLEPPFQFRVERREA